MDWFQAIDIYCERTTSNYWAEPVNAISNGAFVVAAIWAAHSARNRGLSTPILWVLITMAASIGFGSFLFHTHANAWSGLADVAPIWSFVGLFALTAMHYIGGMSVGRVLLVAGLVVMAVAAMIWLMTVGEATPEPVSTPDPLNGSGQYAPAVLVLVAFSIFTWWRKSTSGPWIWAATVVFVFSLAFRTIDMAVCAAFPLGTHFIWHALNGLVIGILLQMLLRILDAQKQNGLR
jgi:hypothetical protein